MLDSDFKEEVIKHMATQSANQTNMAGWLEKLDGKVDKLSTEGCVKGAELEKRVDKLETGPKKKAVGTTIHASGIAALFLGIAKGVEWFFSNR